MAERDTRQVLQNTRDTLDTARLGLADFLGTDAQRRLPGLRNLVVFGRAVTNVLQTLRSAVGPDTFDAWYLPKRAEMEKDNLLKYFYEVRTEILKQGTLPPMGNTIHIGYLNLNDPQTAMTGPPPGATGRFWVDQLGGSGWLVELPDGTETKYYVKLPDGIQSQITTTLNFVDAPDTHMGQSVDGQSVETLAQYYLDYLQDLVNEAAAYFAPPPPA